MRGRGRVRVRAAPGWRDLRVAFFGNSKRYPPALVWDGGCCPRRRLAPHDPAHLARVLYALQPPPSATGRRCAACA